MKMTAPSEGRDGISSAASATPKRDPTVTPPPKPLPKPKPAPTASPIVAPAATPAAPTVKTQADIDKDLWDRVAAGEKYAKDHGIGAVGSMGTLTDPRQAEVNEQLKHLYDGRDGMTPAEMQAAREQGRVEIDRQLAGNMRRLGGVAAANGVRGGSAAGLQSRAFSDAQSASGDLGRKLILDNLNQRNIGTAAYGSALTGQQNVELGIQDRNIGLRNAETEQHNAIPWTIAGALDAGRTSAKTDDLNNRALALGEQQVADTSARVGKEDAKAAHLDELAKSTFTSESGGSYKVQTAADGSKSYISPRGIKVPLIEDGEGKLVAAKQGGGVNKWERAGENQPGCLDGAYCYVATAAMQAGLLDKNTYTSTVTDCPIIYGDKASYAAWGPKLAWLMKRNSYVAAFIGALLPETFLAIRGKRTGYRGKIGFAIYSVCNFITKAVTRGSTY